VLESLYWLKEIINIDKTSKFNEKEFIDTAVTKGKWKLTSF
jgi:hypothetical protein